MRTIGNIIWLLCGGLVMGLIWWLVGLIAFVTIIGIPWGRACFVIGEFSFFPFGREAISRAELEQYGVGTGVLGVLGNVIWFLMACARAPVDGHRLFYSDHWHSIRPPASQTGEAGAGPHRQDHHRFRLCRGSAGRGSISSRHTREPEGHLSFSEGWPAS